MISIIVARDKYRTIGFDGDLPAWKLKSDMKRFKELTSGNVVVMGRTTYESIGRPLPNRTNIVISTDLKDNTGIEIARSYGEAIDLAKLRADQEDCEIFIIGGQSIYELALRSKDVDRLLITLVDGEFEGDTHFPETPIKRWKLTDYEIHQKDEDNSHNYAFMNYSRRRPGEGYEIVFYYPSSRSAEQTQKMLEIENLGICPFCPDWLEWYHDNPIMYESKHWVVTRNDNPYSGTVLDLLIISKHHCTHFRQMPEEAQAEFGQVVTWVENNCGYDFFGFGMRVGAIEKVAGSINHLHGHFKVGDIENPSHKPITFKMSNRPRDNKPPESY